MEEKYIKQAKIIIKTEMAKKDIGYPELAQRLKKIGINESRVNLANKVNRGKFTFAFALQIFDVLDVKKLNLGE